MPKNKKKPAHVLITTEISKLSNPNFQTCKWNQNYLLRWGYIPIVIEIINFSNNPGEILLTEFHEIMARSVEMRTFLFLHFYFVLWNPCENLGDVSGIPRTHTVNKSPSHAEAEMKAVIRSFADTEVPATPKAPTHRNEL